MTISRLLAAILALAAPWFAWPLEIFFPQPAVIEELLKAGILAVTLSETPTLTHRLQLAAITGGLFAFSESIFYLVNYLALGVPDLFFTRLIYTGPLHLITTLLIALPASTRPKLLIGLPLAVVVHYLANLYLSGL